MTGKFLLLPVMSNATGKRKARGCYDFQEGHTQLSIPSVKRINFTSMSDSGSYSGSTVLGTLPTQSSQHTHSTVPDIQPEQPESGDPLSPRRQTQVSMQTLLEW
jgi:hypothetical protein